MRNRFKTAIHSELRVALSEYEKLAERYEDVRLEKTELSFGSVFYTISYRYPKG